MQDKSLRWFILYSTFNHNIKFQTAIKANVTSAELYFRDGRSLSSYIKESVIPGRHQRLEYNYSIDVLDVFKVGQTDWVITYTLNTYVTWLL